MSRCHAAISTLLLLTMVGCAVDGPTERDDGSVAKVASAIVNGTASTDSQDSVVFLVTKDARGVLDMTCTATLLAPNLVVTARHCVSTSRRSVIACDRDGNDLTGGATIMSDRQPSQVGIVVGKDRHLASPVLRVAARGLRILHPASTSLCSADIAFIVLDQAVPNAVTAPVRLDAGPRAGDSVSVVGWGVTDSGDEPERRQQRASVVIRRVGPQAGTALEPPIGPAEFELGESICAGDSGSPAFHDVTGAVIGVVSRGGNGAPRTPDSCLGPNTLNEYTSLAAFKTLALDAYRAAGQEPWLEGAPDPRAVAEADSQPSCSVARHPRSSAWLGVVTAIAIAVTARRRSNRHATS